MNPIAMLYCLIGEAVWQIQRLEEALSRSLTLKNDVKTPGSISSREANQIFEDYHSHTLGKAIKIATKNGIYSDSIQKNLDDLLSDRNWLVHKCMIEHFDDMRFEESRNRLFIKIKEVYKKAKELEDSLTEDMLKFSIQQGLDMSKVKAAIQAIQSYPNEGVLWH